INGATAISYLLTQAEVGSIVSVEVSYTDGGGAIESLVSSAVGPVANVNDAPSGLPIIGGIATQNQALNANTGGISDDDGLGLFAYQWQANGVNIAGANATTYALTQAEVGALIRLVVSYTDAGGTPESLTSAAVGPVANVNDAPAGLPVVTGTPTQNQPLGVDTGGISDVDGLGAFGYQWQADGVDIVGATNVNYTLTQNEVGANVSINVRYTDGGGTPESLASAAVGPVANVNDAPVGLPLVNGTPTQGLALNVDTASIGDADGLGAFGYQWRADGVDITGATGNSYLLTQADVGASISVVVSYTDGGGAVESLTSAAVGPVANVNDAPSGQPVIIGTPTQEQILNVDSSSIGDIDGLGAFSYQWRVDGFDISGATAASFSLTQAEVGSTVTVVVSYTDGGGSIESLTSAGVGPIANLNDAPAGLPLVGGLATQGQTLTADTASISDADGLGVFAYQWQANGVDIGGATGISYLLSQAEVGALISVVVGYTDGGGTIESLVSASVGPVANTNDVPTGLPVITGTPTQNQTLTADTAGIGDVDGLGPFGYQWQADGVDIGGASSNSYTLTQAEVGSNIGVVVSYTDGGGTNESLASASVGPVTNSNDAPTGLPVITGTPTQNQTLSADTASIGDLDGLGPFGYQWQADGVDIGGATSASYTLTQAEVGSTITLIVSYTDGGGTNESLSSTTVGPVTNSNDAPTGLPVISGAPTQNQTLTADTASIGDADGLGVFSYQWQADAVDIAGATSSSYTLTQAEVGSTITVIVSYTDGGGTNESLTSAGVGPVINVNDAPLGLPVITGSASQGQLLSADTAAVSDADGLGAFAYQWQADAVDITGANGSSYTLTQTEVGSTITVIVSYTDGGGTSEILTSAAVGPVTNANDPPLGLPSIDGTPTQGQLLTANTSGISDADGLGAFSYQWQADAVDIGSATNDSLTLTQAEVGSSITVIVSYTDGGGTGESLTSATVGPVANINDAPTGLPVIGGIATQDQTLSVDTTGIGDADGLGAFSYQWQADAIDIAGASGSSYALTQNEVGSSVTVIVSYTDGGGFSEILTSAGVGPVANINDAPVGLPVIAGSASQGQLLSADTTAISDADGLGPFAYQWQADGVDITGTISNSYSLTQAEVGSSITLIVSYTDGGDTNESLTSAAVGPVADVNDDPVGQPAITGIATQGEILGADTTGISDADGLGAFSFQWQADGVDIASATSNSYTLTQAEVGSTITVIVSYLDGGGTNESLTSAAVGPVTDANDDPVGQPVISGTATQGEILAVDTTGISDADGLGAFSYQWQADGAAITGATNDSLMLSQAEVGSLISVAVIYTDGGGTLETVTSGTVGPVANINDPPSGVPTIDGGAIQGQTLTANTSGITDADGIGPFSYQWQANAVDIAGANNDSLTLSQAEVGTAISLVVSYIDFGGMPESLSSAAIGPVIDVNDPPSGLPVINGTPEQNQVLSVDATGIGDADGLGSFSYQWQADGLDIAGANGTSLVLTQADVGSSIVVSVSYTDGGGTLETVVSAIVGPVANVNDAPVGLPVVNGNASTGEVLSVDTAAISDADGLGVFSYQWQADGLDIVGASNASYTLTSAEVGSLISVEVSYIDAGGTAESLLSASVGPVVDGNQAPVAIITAPASGSSFVQGIGINFSGSASDNEDGDISDQLSWTSNLDGPLGTGASLNVATLSVGTHVISATVTDSGGLGPFIDPSITIDVTTGSVVDTSYTLNYQADNEALPSDGVWNDLVGQVGFDYTLTAPLISGPITVYSGITRAYQFDGTNAVGGLSDSLQNVTGNPTNSSASFEIWLRPADLADSDVVFETGGGTDGTSFTITDVNGNGLADDIRFTVKDSATTVTVSANLGQLLGNVTAEFFQVVGVYDRTPGGTTDAVRLYVNGVLVAEDLSAVALDDWAGGGDTGLARANGGMNVGGMTAFEGEIAILRFYEKAMSASEVQDNFSAVSGAGGIPAVTISQPTAGSVFTAGDTIMFSASANDIEDGDLSSGLQWTSDLDGHLGTGSSISAILSVGDHLVGASVTDSSGLTGSNAVNLSVSAINTQPTITILSPADGAQFDTNDTISFNAAADDPEDGVLDASIVWTSDLDGPLGSGASVQTGLSQGSHQVTASVTDSGGLSANITISLTVIAGAPVIDSSYTLNYEASDETLPSDGVWNEAGGQSAFDFSLGASLTASPITVFSGISQAYQFDGSAVGTTNSLQDIAGNPSNNSASFEIWLRPADTADTDMIFETGGSGDGTAILITDADADSVYDDLQFVIKDSGTTVAVTADLSLVVGNVMGEFIQVVGVYNRNHAGSSDTVQLYVNGALIAESQVNTLNDWAGGNNTGLGGVNSGVNVSGTTAFEGDIAILRFYQKAMTGADVAGNFNAVSSTAP
ncbi:MAG: LamG domain-containing protein, partial [Gammaproteobacteria bacterium]|nr:LamG domain-containing protein [Gammaproteobacteria bacterium]